MRLQLDDLFEENILRYTSLSQLKHYPRYLQALEIRLDKLNLSSSDDNVKNLYILNAQFLEFIKSELIELNAKSTDSQALKIDALYHIYPQYFKYAMLLQEWRVSIFAQQLKTSVPVSYKRICKAASRFRIKESARQRVSY